jgi:hypothetical protein
MKMKKNILIVALLMSLSTLAYNQSFDSDYKFAIGLRAGYPAGITFKFKTASESNVELIAGFWTGLFNITALFEKNVPAFHVDGMNWYFGGGGHLTFLQDRIKDESNRWYYNRGEGYAFGIDGVVGLEYKIPPIPFAISLDLKPTIEIDRNSSVYFGIDPGLGLKFTF